MPTVKQHVENMTKLIERVGYYSPREVMADFVEMGAIAMSNAVDRRMFSEREPKYLKLIAKYKREHQFIFRQLLEELTEAQSVEPGDILGRLYMQIGAANADSGQFFTPPCISSLVSRLCVDEDNMRKQIEKRGFVTLNEPTAGAGAMVISFAFEMLRLGFNFQNCLHCTLVDVDHRAALMSYLQLSILHIPAVVVHGNTLTMEEYSHWYTPAHVLNGFTQRLQQKGEPEQQRQVDLAWPVGSSAPLDAERARSMASPHQPSLF